MSLYDRVRDLPLVIESADLAQHSRDTSSDFTRVSTTFGFSGDGVTGRGEDVTYDTPDHERLAAAGLPDLTGEFTLESFSGRLDSVELFSAAPERETAHHYRRWGLESAALDLALRQAGETLGSALGREYRPVRFVVSTRLEDFSRVETLLAANPDAEFKLDPTEAWDDALVERLAATGRVRILDLKGHYEGTDVDGAPDPGLYRRIAEAFPEAVIEDPALTEETEPVIEEIRDRVSWDAPITGVESIEALPFEPRWLNVKPSRFGTVESLFETLDYCEGRGTNLYGGGQFELDVGRSHVQALASLFYPDAPNDVAPGGYNDPDPARALPRSPLPVGSPAGLAF
jgi:hypothetical protein